MNKDNHLRQFLSGQRVTLEALLEQKEQRARNQQRLLAQGRCLICFTLNIAGPVKTSPALSLAFEDGRSRILQQLRWQEINVKIQEETVLPGGRELYILVDAPPERVKALMVQIEDSCPMGRLFDMDVLGELGQILSREALGYPPRKCLLCENSAVLCARGKAHSKDALLEKTVFLICDHFNRQYADTVAQLCCRALLYEVAVTPKPGLVDRNNTGAHCDMDFFTFLDSTAALTPYFRDCVLLGIQCSHLPPSELFQTLRYPGRRAEDEMYRATGGINTHKGAIFSMGILCAALGRLYDRELPWRTADVFALCREMCAGLVERDMEALHGKAHSSPGERLYARYGFPGARGEAAAGFPSVSEIGLPALKGYLADGKSRNDAGILTLLQLMAQVEDTNMLHRSSPEIVERLQSRLRERLARGDVTILEIEALNGTLSRQNLSPGGCADLLALSYFLLLVEEEILKKP